jgi:PAS domain S-box-containing protein
MKESLYIQQMLTLLPLGMYLIDSDFTITFFNEQAEKITGYTRQEALGRKCYEILRTGLCNEKCPVKQALRNSGPQASRTRTNLLNRRQRKIPMEITSVSLRDAQGHFMGALESLYEDHARTALEKEVKKNYAAGDIVSKDAGIQKLLGMLPTIAESEITVLILGETGTGKDVLARAIHHASPRRLGPFIRVNCAALPQTLLESELFGFKKGAFTSAGKDKPGRFQLADGGTIFLDEIGEIPLEMQAKILHTLENREFYSLGSTSPTRVNVRIIAATNRNLTAMAGSGTFRPDLFYRLNVCELEMPPLRERFSDIPLLIDHFLEQACAIHNKPMPRVSPEALKILLHYAYPGNIRELKNIIEYALMFNQESIGAQHLPGFLVRSPALPTPPAPCQNVPPAEGALSLEAVEKSAILEVLRDNHWRIQNAARTLGVNRTTLWRKMKKHRLQPPTRRG